MRDGNMLPNKPSALIRLALDDLEKVEQDGRYRVDMSLWHVGRRWAIGEPCRVCLAGAVMSKTMGANLDASIVPGSTTDDDYKLRSLNAFREGRVRVGLHWFYKSGEEDCPVVLDERQHTRSIGPYAPNPDGLFKADMRRLADDLEEIGI